MNLPARRLSVAELHGRKLLSEASDLRRECYTRRGKLALADPESYGTLFGIYAGERLVGSIRMFAPGEHDRLECVDVPLGHYPADLPRKTDSIEISGLCLLPEFRNVDSFKVIYAQVHRFLVENNRAWILIGADHVLAKKYRFIGFRHTGHVYEKKGSAFPRISIMASNQKRFGVYGLHADPFRWNLFLRDITDELRSERKIHHPLPTRLVFGLYRGFRGPAKLLEAAIRRKLIRA